MKKRLAIILSILVVAFAAIGVGVYFYFGSTKALFTKALTKSINELFDNNSSILNNIKYDTIKIKTKNNIDLTLDKDSYSASISGNVSYDKSIKKIISDLSVTANKEKIVDFDAVLEDSKLYVKIKDLMSKYYYLDMSFDSSSIDNLDKKDIKHVKDLVQNSFFGLLKESDFTKGDQKITLEKEINTKKISLKLTSKRIGEISKKVLEDIKNDKKAMSIIQKTVKDFTEKSINEDIKNIENTINTLNNKDYLLYTIYIVNDDTIVRHEISANSEENNTINDYKLIINTYDNSNNLKTKELIVNLKENMFAKISIVGTTKDTSNITITSDIISGTGTITKSATEESIDIAFSMQTMNIGNISAKISKVSNTEYSLNTSINVQFLTYKAAFNSENKIVLNEKITDVDLKDAKKFETMNETEQNKIMTTIMMKIAKAFPKLME